MLTSDFARATGVFMYTSSSYYGNGYWWLRSPSDNGRYSARAFGYDGNVSSLNYVFGVSYGVVPALRILL